MKDNPLRRCSLCKSAVLMLILALTLVGVPAAVGFADAPEAEIEVVQKNKFAVILYHMDKTTYWNGCTVTLTPEGKTSKTLTTVNGRAEFNMSDILAEGQTFNFCALEVTDPSGKMQSFEASKVYCTGGEGRMLYLERNDRSTPYASSMTFDGEDMLMYRNGIYVTKANDVSHKIFFKMYAQGKGGGTVSLCENGKVIASKTVSPDGNGYISAEFADMWCQKLTPKAKLSVKTDIGGKSYTTDAQLDITAAVATPVIKNDVQISLTNGSGESTKKLPYKFPGFGGRAINYGLPIQKYTMFIAPDGKVYMGNNVYLEPFRTGDGKNIDHNKWKTTSMRILNNWSRKENKRAMLVLQAGSKGIKIANLVLAKVALSPTATFEMDMRSFGYGQGTYNPSSKKAEVALKDVRQFSFKYGMRQGFSVGVIPCFVGYDFTIGANAYNEFVAHSTDYNSMPFVIDASTSKVTYETPVKIGISGGTNCIIASAYVRGYGNIYPQVKIADKKTNARIEAIIGADIVVECCDWRKDFQIVKFGPDTLFNQTRDSAVLLAAASQDEGAWVDTVGANGAGIEANLEVSAAADEHAIQAVADSDGNIRSDGYVINAAPVCSSIGAHLVTGAPELAEAPYSEKKVLENVLSDNKAQVVNVGIGSQSTPYLFRISACKVDGKNVSRVTYSKYNGGSWSTPVPVLSTVSGLNYTNEVFDYDFDVKTFHKDDNTEYIYIALLAGKRGGDMESTRALAEMYTIRMTLSGSSFISTAVAKPKKVDGTILFHPMVGTQDDCGRAEKGYYGCLLQKVEDGGSKYAVTQVTTESGRADYDFELTPCGGRWYDKPITQAALGKGSLGRGTTLLYLVSDGDTGGQLYRTYGGNAREDKSKWTIMDMTMTGNGTVSCIQAVNSQITRGVNPGFMIAVCKEPGAEGKLYYLYDDGEPKQQDTGVTIGSPFFSLTAHAQFQSGGYDTGFYVYWCETKDGKNLIGETVSDHELHCVRVQPKGRQVSVTEPYMLSKLKNAPDKLTAWINSKNTIDAMYSHLLDMNANNNAAADLYYLQVRPVAGLDFSALMPMEPCVGAGETTKMRVRVTNTGTLPIKSFYASLSGTTSGGTPLTPCSLSITDLKDQHVNDNGDVKSTDDKHKLLVPGATNVYEGDVRIPSDYNGRVKLKILFWSCSAGIDANGQVIVAGSDGVVASDGFITIGTDNEATWQTQFGYDPLITQPAEEMPECEMGFNDLAIEAERLNIGGEEYVKVFLQNLGNNVANAVLNCRVDGSAVSLPLAAPITLNEGRSGNCKNILLPLSAITGGRVFDCIEFTLSGADEYDDCDNSYMLGRPVASSGGGEYTTGYTAYSGAQYPFTQKGVWQKDGSLQFVNDADCEKLVSVLVDGNMLEKKDYTVFCGSTIVLLHKDFLAALDAAKEHTLCLIFTDGRAETTFFAVKNSLSVSRIAELPATGCAPSLLPAALLAVLPVAFIAVKAWEKRRSARSAR